MTTTATSYVVEFDLGPDIPAFRVYAEPSSPEIGQAYEIRAVAPFAISVSSPYAAATASTTATAETLTEEVNLGGSLTPSTVFPVASIGSAVAITPIVDADGVVVASAGASIAALLAVRSATLTSERELWGSVRLTYTSFAAKVWSYGGQDVAGEYVYLATAAELAEPEHVVVSVGGAADQQPAYRITTDPASPTVDVDFVIDVRAASTFTMQSPYGATLTATPAAADTVTTTVALGGNTNVNAEQPISSLTSATVVTPIIDADGTIVATAGANFAGSLEIANGSLVLAEAYYGSIRLVYKGFPGQRFAVAGLSPAGQYLFLADSDALSEPVPVTVDVGELSTSWSWASESDGAARIVSLYVRPWRASVSFHHAAGGNASFVYQGVETETVEETIEIVDGAGNASKAIVEVLDSEWRYTDLGSVSTTEDGAITADTAGNSILWLQYTTRKHVWRGTAAVEQVLVYIDE